jgi:hypothetical protein
MAAARHALHQDFWFGRDARPLVSGFLPIGLVHHAAYTAAISPRLMVIASRGTPGSRPAAATPAKYC